MVESLTHVEEEDSLEPDIPTVETNPKNPMWRVEQERGDCGQAVCRNRCSVCIRDRCVEKRCRIDPLVEEEKGAKRPLVSFDYVFSTQGNADMLSTLIRRNDGHSQTGVMCCERKDSTPS